MEFGIILLKIIKEGLNMQKLTSQTPHASRAQHASNLSKKLTALLLAAVLLFTTLLAGCSADEVSLFYAITHEPKKLSYELECNARMQMKFDILDPDFNDWYYPSTEILKSIESLMEDAGVSIKAQYNMNSDNTKGQFGMVATPLLFGGALSNFSTGYWVDTDPSSPVYFKQYVKLPKTIMSGIAWETFKGKDYLVMTSDDLGTIKEETDIDLPVLSDPEKYKAQADASEKLISSLADGLSALVGLLDTKTAFVLGVDHNAAGGDTVYHVKITDKGLKEIIKSFTKIDKKDMKEISLSLLKAAADYMKYMDANGDTFQGGLPTWVKMLDLALPQYDMLFDMYYSEIIDAINDFAKSTNKFKMLGNDGIKLDICISGDGYITGLDGIIDLVIDHRGYDIANGYRYDGSISKTHVKLTFDCKYTNVNGDVVVDMPKVTPRNSITYSQIIEEMNANNNSYPYNSMYDYDMGSIDPGSVIEPDAAIGDYSGSSSYS